MHVSAMMSRCCIPASLFCMCSERRRSVHCAAPDIASPRKYNCGRVQVTLRGLAMSGAVQCAASMQQIYNNL